MFAINDMPHRPPETFFNPEKKSKQNILRIHTLAEFFFKNVQVGCFVVVVVDVVVVVVFPQYPDKRRSPLVQIHAPGSKNRNPCTQSAGGVPK